MFKIMCEAAEHFSRGSSSFTISLRCNACQPVGPIFGMVTRVLEKTTAWMAWDSDVQAKRSHWLRPCLCYLAFIPDLIFGLAGRFKGKVSRGVDKRGRSGKIEGGISMEREGEGLRFKWSGGVEIKSRAGRAREVAMKRARKGRGVEQKTGPRKPRWDRREGA